MCRSAYWAVTLPWKERAEGATGDKVFAEKGERPVVCRPKACTGQRLRSWSVESWSRSGYNRPSVMAYLVASTRLLTPILS
jgi:hypothetical protein